MVVLLILFLFVVQTANAVELNANEEDNNFRQLAPIKEDDIGIGLNINQGSTTIEVENDIEAPTAFVPSLGFGEDKVTINLNINGGNIIGNIQDSQGATFTPLRLVYNQKGGSLRGNIDFTNNADDEPDFVNFSNNAVFQGNILMNYGIISFSDTSFTGMVDGSFSQPRNFQGQPTRLIINLNGIDWFGGNFLITKASTNPLVIVHRGRNRLAANVMFADVVVRPNAVLEFLLPISVRGDLKLEPKAILRYHNRVEIVGTFSAQKGAVIESFLGDKLVKKIIATGDFSTEQTILTDPLLLEIGEEAPIEGEPFIQKEEGIVKVSPQPQPKPETTSDTTPDKIPETILNTNPSLEPKTNQIARPSLIPIQEVATNFSHLNAIGLEQRITPHKMAVSGRQNRLEFISTKTPQSQYEGFAIWTKALLTVGKGRNTNRGKNKGKSVGFVVGGDMLAEKYSVGIALGKISSKDDLSSYEYIKANGYTFSIYGSFKPYGKAVTIQSISSYTLQHNKVNRNYQDASGQIIASSGKFKSKILTFENTIGVNFRAFGPEQSVVITPYLGVEDAILSRSAYSETIKNSDEKINIPQGGSQRHSSILGVRTQAQNIKADIRWIRAFAHNENGFFYFSRGGAHFIPAPTKNRHSFRAELGLSGEGFGSQSRVEVSVFVHRNKTYQMLGLAGIYRIQF